MTGICYLDTSACVKLVVPEAETDALVGFLGDRQDQASSVVLDIELTRAAARAGPAAAAGARMLLGTIALIPLSTEIRGIARSVSPPSLRSLDAIHLATAAALGADLGVLVAYDHQLLDAARDLGLPVASPT